MGRVYVHSKKTVPKKDVSYSPQKYVQLSKDKVNSDKSLTTVIGNQHG